MPLSFRQAGNTFVGGPNISIYPSGNTYAISGSAAGIISGTNVGAGVAVFSGVVGTNMVFRTLRSGLNTSVSISGNNIVISAGTGAINGITAVTTVGGGIAVASSVTANALVSRTLSGANGIDVVESGNLVIIRPSSTLTTNRFLIAGTGGAITTSDAYQVDSTNGTMALGFITQGDQLPILSRLSIAPGSATISQIRLTPFSARYSAATAGDIFYNSTSGNTLFFNKTTTLQTSFLFKDNNYSLTGATSNRILQADTGGTITSFYYPTSLGIFNSITSTTITGTNELSVFNTGSTVLIGTYILNSSSHGTAPQLITGKKYRFNARGTINTDTTPGNLTARLKLGSATIATSVISLASSINGNFFEIDCTFTIRSQGASGTVQGSGKMLTDWQYLQALTSPVVAITSLGNVTIDTTVDAAFNFTLQNTNTGNIFVINEATLEYLN